MSRPYDGKSRVNGHKDNLLIRMAHRKNPGDVVLPPVQTEDYSFHVTQRLLEQMRGSDEGRFFLQILGAVD